MYSIDEQCCPVKGKNQKCGKDSGKKWWDDDKVVPRKSFESDSYYSCGKSEDERKVDMGICGEKVEQTKSIIT